LDLLEEGKKEDTEKNYQEALDYYTDALERLLKVYQSLIAHSNNIHQT
jgi:hypothetical protein